MSSEGVASVGERVRASNGSRVRAPSALWCGVVMLLVKIALRAAGFERTFRWMRATSRRVNPRIEANHALIDSTARAVAIAGALYPGRALCLEQSLVLYWCLRRRGVEAELRLGVQPRPFAAHAWVECWGEPVNDHPERLTGYTAPGGRAVRRFICLIRPSGAPIGSGVRNCYGTIALGQRINACWTDMGAMSVISESDDAGLGPTVASAGPLVAIGEARLDNRPEVEQLTTRSRHGGSDLDVILAALDQHGPTCIQRVVGDFAFVAWNATTRQILAARDAFGVKTLYYCEQNDICAFSTHASLITPNGEYDLDYIADYLVGAYPLSDRSIFRRVYAVPPGCVWRYHRGTQSTTRFWSAASFALDETMCTEAQRDEFRELFSYAVRARLTAQDYAWSQLSGGIDSSSVVCMAQSMAESGQVAKGIAGTVTLVDSLGGDERVYSDAVVRKFRIPNEQVLDYWMWQDDGVAPPLTDRPHTVYPFFARDRMMCALVRRGGGRVLLSGYGSDQYLTGNLLFAADKLSGGSPLAAARDLIDWAVLTRASVWQLAWENALVPLLPRRIRHLVKRTAHPPAWIDRVFLKRYNIKDRLPALRILDAPAGHKYAGGIAYLVDNLAAHLDHGITSDALEVRYPFLYRPLVEYCLRLPPPMRTGALRSKRILREAMRGVLPEDVRMRRTKGMIDGRIQWSLSRERARIDRLLEDPILGQLGAVDVPKLKAAVDAARAGDAGRYGEVLLPLSLETWLSVRSGRWTERS